MRKVSLIIMLAIFFTACKKQEALGPDIDGIYGPVTVTQPFSASTNSVNFTTGGKVFFNAGFQNDAVWIIKIKGVTSKAVKTISGVGKSINIDNSTWNGSADGAPSFQVENVIATLTFQNTPDVLTTPPIAITGKFVSGSSTDVLVTDFVISKVQNYGALPVPPTKWPSDFPLTVNTETAYGFPDGNAYLVMGPNPAWQGAGSPYIDILTITSSNSIIDYGQYFPLYADASKVYFNIMVYDTETPTWLHINLLQDGKATRGFDVKPNWGGGWKLISVRLSDLLLGTDNAQTEFNPQKISGIEIVMLSNLAVTDPNLTVTPVKAAFDHIIFTHNAPYQP